MLEGESIRVFVKDSLNATEKGREIKITSV